MELDHIFLFVKDRSAAEQMMARAGLCVNYSRKHPGQGTENLCACFDNIFLELLWLDESELCDESENIGLGGRGRGAGSPFGVSWRGQGPVDCVPYAPPYLPAGVSIPVARASLDPALPFVFQTPGGVAPIERKDGLVGLRQSPRFSVVERCVLRMPHCEAAHDLLAPFAMINVAEGPIGIEACVFDTERQSTVQVSLGPNV